MTTLVIAEAGVNHNGSLELALALVDAAATAGASIVKFQTFRADDLVTPMAAKARYQVETTGAAESQHSMLRRLELTSSMHAQLVDRCAATNIEFLSSAFDLSSLDYLCELGVRRLKVPSGEITNLPYLERVGRAGLPVILSTGMATLGEVEAALDTLERAGTSRASIIALQCTTAYPARAADANLRAMLSMREAFGVDVGLSDHTQGIEITIAAVALGACVIEKHFTLDRTLPGPDHRASLEPEELRQMVTCIRNVELALGDGRKRPSPLELENRPIARKSIVAARDIQSGEVFTSTNLTVKRPGTGISPMRLPELIGRRATRAFAADEQIEL